MKQLLEQLSAAAGMPVKVSVNEDDCPRRTCGRVMAGRCTWAALDQCPVKTANARLEELKR